MIHFALVVAAVLFLGWVALHALEFVLVAFDENAGCGCLALLVVAVGTIIIIAISALSFG